MTITRGQEVLAANGAAHYARPCKAIGELESVPSARIHQKSQVEDLQGQFARIREETTQLVKITKKKGKKCQSRKNSIVVRSFYTLFNKKEEYDERVNKAERQYDEFLQKQTMAQEQQSNMENRLREARELLKNLAEKESRVPSELITGCTSNSHTPQERRDKIQAKFISSESQAKKELDSDLQRQYMLQFLMG